MEFKKSVESGVSVISITGRLDAVTAPEFEREVRALIEGGENSLVVNFAELEYISSAGLRVLLMMAKLLQARGGKARFACVGATVKSVFDMSGFNTLFQMDADVPAAIQGLGALSA